MNRRRLLITLLASCALAVFSGCASILPDHVTYFAERDNADTNATRRQRTLTRKFGLQVTYDLRSP